MFADDVKAQLVSEDAADTAAIFVGSKSRPVPPCLVVLDRGGPRDMKVHDQTTPSVRYPKAFVEARATTRPVAAALIERAYDALLGVRNQAVNGTHYLSMTPMEPGDFGSDTTDVIRIGMYVEGERGR